MTPARKLTLDEAKERLYFCDSYMRLPVLLSIKPLLETADWFQLLGKVWNSCDNIGAFYLQLVVSMHLNGERPIREMMNRHELRAFHRLPDEIIIYRGCYRSNVNGLSWSLSEAVARKFPTYVRYRQEGVPLLVTATVRKENVIAVKLDRKEQEIITLYPEIISVRDLREAEQLIGGG